MAWRYSATVVSPRNGALASLAESVQGVQSMENGICSNCGRSIEREVLGEDNHVYCSIPCAIAPPPAISPLVPEELPNWGDNFFEQPSANDRATQIGRRPTKGAAPCRAA